MKRPRIGLLLGDPSGIGPEVTARLLALPSCHEMADVLVIGDSSIYHRATAVAQVPDVQPQFLPYLGEVEEYAIGKVSVEAGRYVLGSIRAATTAFQQAIIDAIVFPPFNKQAMKLAGLAHEDELHYFAELLDVQSNASEMNIFGALWTSRVTSHVPFREIAGLLTIAKVYEATINIHQALVDSGCETPRIAVAALNPHAGEGGQMGMEDIEILQPAVEQARKSHVDATGPWPADTVFVAATRGRFDGVVTMYHDQGQIALKLLGFDRGVTYLRGLPCVVTTPAHGTAFDIVGTGTANVEPIYHAFQLAARMAARRIAARPVQGPL